MALFLTWLLVFAATFVQLGAGSELLDGLPLLHLDGLANEFVHAKAAAWPSVFEVGDFLSSSDCDGGAEQRSVLLSLIQTELRLNGSLAVRPDSAVAAEGNPVAMEVSHSAGLTLVSDVLALASPTAEVPVKAFLEESLPMSALILGAADTHAANATSSGSDAADVVAVAADAGSGANMAILPIFVLVAMVVFLMAIVICEGAASGRAFRPPDAATLQHPAPTTIWSAGSDSPRKPPALGGRRATAGLLRAPPSGGYQPDMSSGDLAAGGIPPPICASLILPNAEACFEIHLESLARGRAPSMEILGTSGRKLLQATTTMLPNGRNCLAIASAGCEDEPRAAVCTSSKVGVFEVFGRGGQMYGTLEMSSNGTGGVLHHDGLPVMVVEIGSRPDLRATATTPDGQILGSAGRKDPQEPGMDEMWRLQARPGVDSVLLCASMLSLMLLRAPASLAAVATSAPVLPSVRPVPSVPAGVLSPLAQAGRPSTLPVLPATRRAALEASPLRSSPTSQPSLAAYQRQPAPARGRQL